MQKCLLLLVLSLFFHPILLSQQGEGRVSPQPQFSSDYASFSAYRDDLAEQARLEKRVLGEVDKGTKNALREANLMLPRFGLLNQSEINQSITAYYNTVIKNSATFSQCADQSEWLSIGPDVYPEKASGAENQRGIGRMLRIHKSPTNSDTYFGGSASGGLWATQDEGLLIFRV